MLTLLFSVLGIVMTTTMTKGSKLWSTTVTQSSMALVLASLAFSKMSMSTHLHKDKMSTPLMVLSFWLIPVSLLASAGHLQKKAVSKNQTFIILTLAMLTALMMTFSCTNLILFFMGFECTLVPTLFLMSRWGMQEERIEAGYYFVFYTLASSLPLLIALVTLYSKDHHLSFLLFKVSPPKMKASLLVIFCLMAFLVKVPMFGLHLWLPKAHVEAPVAGSMMLAAILLKLGGYGFMRLTKVFTETFQKSMSTWLVPFCCWGGALTSIMCMTQTDLKSLMAYSSVSHMSFMVAGMSMTSEWSMAGGVMVMMAHGLVSSALFCMAKVYYERTGTRKLSASRGMKSLVLVLPTMWLIFAGANLGLPPMPKAVGEILVFSAMVAKKVIKFLPTVAGVVFTGIFSLFIYQQLKTGTHFLWNHLSIKISEREYTTLFLHLIPLLMLMANPKMMSM